MALPIAVIAFKVLSLKFIKGAIVGCVRYAHKIHRKEHKDSNGNTLNSRAKIEHIVRNELAAKDNMVFLILMLGNVFFGAQELITMIWMWVGKRFFTEFRTGIPSALEDPEKFAQRIHQHSWLYIWREIARWLAIASLIYWPKKIDKTPKLTAHKNPEWVELSYGRHVYLLKINNARECQIADLNIHISTQRLLQIFHLQTGEKLLESEV